MVRSAADDRRVDTIREAERERQKMIRQGDLKTLIRSATDCDKHYQQMANNFNEWANVVRTLERERRETAKGLEKFASAAEKLLGDSLSFVLEELTVSSVVKPEEVTEVADDSAWGALLVRISDADTCRALKMSHDGYKLAGKTIGSFTSKLHGMKMKNVESGSTAAEVATAQRLIPKMEFALEVLGKRKEVMADINRKSKATLRKWMEKHTCRVDDDREITDEELAAIKDLI